MVAFCIYFQYNALVCYWGLQGVEMKRRIKKAKPVLVGIFVCVFLFAGLMIYLNSLEKDKGDLIQTDGDISSEEEQAPEQYEEPVIYPEEPEVIFVDVGGAVAINGLFALPGGSRVDDAIKAAGGLTEEAEMKYINRASVLKDGDKLYIPTKTEVLNGTAPQTSGIVSDAGSQGFAAAGTDPGAAQLININTAGSEELQKLSGVGPVTAQKIIDYRTKHGRFNRIEDIMNVSGIGAKTFEKLRDHITI